MAEERIRRRDHLAERAALILLALALTGSSPPPERGMALGLFSADPNYRYRSLLEEIRALGVTHVSIDWVWWQQTIKGEEIAPVRGWSATDEQIADSIRTAKQLGFHVTAFPIVRLEKVGPGEWRGTIEPDDRDAWWDSYLQFILHSAEVAARSGADRLTIGSELLSREHERERWKDLIDRVRIAAPDLELMYSANWDHFEPVSFWDLVDVVGLTAYWELTKDLDASADDLERSWQLVKPKIVAFSERLGRPIVFTEIGYPSLDGGAAWPWDETRRAPVDLEEQHRAYLAFVRAWSGTKQLHGVYFWNWFGFGGKDDGNYTPRNKPAASVVREWYGSKK